MTTFHIRKQHTLAPDWGRKRANEKELNVWKAACAVFVLCAVMGISHSSATAQTFTTLFVFDATDGGFPSGPLVQGTDGNLYGTTNWGGAYGGGSVFRITPGGALTTLYSFCSQVNCADGHPLISGLVLATDGSFYGVTATGGAFGHGTIFKITPQGALTTLHNFCSQANCPDGQPATGIPNPSLIQASDGNFYGITTTGGAFGHGTIFKITPQGALTTLHNFCSQANCPDGQPDPAFPNAGLIQATDGNFYGTTAYGGSDGVGTVFRMTPKGNLTTLYSFKGGLEDGMWATGLIQAADGCLYGTTYWGGTAAEGGTLFKITAAGDTIVDSLGGWLGYDALSLMQATDRAFYVTTAVGGGNGTSGQGTIVKVTSEGEVTLLHSFDLWSGFPSAGVTQATDGNFYGITATNGPDTHGTIFRLSEGLNPFGSFIRASGKVGQTAQILGQGFTGTTSVSFNGTPVAFKVKSDTYLTATVPAGATTGYITVTTPGGTLKSNKIFRVVPQIFSFSPTSGPVGTSVVITGESLKQTTEVSLVACKWKMSFTVDSDTQITATVPPGAPSGKIIVATAGGRAASAESFTVTP
jgi:uncharacterized repeat protein (TIGR03803 family)